MAQIKKNQPQKPEKQKNPEIVKNINNWSIFLVKLKNFLEETAMYIFTTAGVLMSKYMPAFKEIFKSQNEKEITFNIPYRAEIIAALFIALLVTYMMERQGDKEGKRKRFKRRALSHLANGVLWYTIVGG